MLAWKKREKQNLTGVHEREKGPLLGPEEIGGEDPIVPFWGEPSACRPERK